MTQGVPPPQVVVPGQGWVDLASRVIVTVGFPVVVAGVLLWYVLGDFRQGIGSITARLSSNVEAIAKLVAAEEGTLSELRKQTDQLSAQTEELKAQTEVMRRVLELRQRESGVGR